MNYLWALVVAFVTGIVVWWVRSWKWPIPATLKCRVRSIQKQDDGYSLQLEVLETNMPPAADVFQRWAQSYVRRRLPQAGQAYTFWVPEAKMRAELHEGDEVAITGRVLQPMGRRASELSIHGTAPLEER